MQECYNKNKTTLKANITKEDDSCGKKKELKEKEKKEIKEKEWKN